jgi:hypothetical protein
MPRHLQPLLIALARMVSADYCLYQDRLALLLLVNAQM